MTGCSATISAAAAALTPRSSETVINTKYATCTISALTATCPSAAPRGRRGRSATATGARSATHTA
jgi:hypothetical protein